MAQVGVFNLEHPGKRFRKGVLQDLPFHPNPRESGPLVGRGGHPEPGGSSGTVPELFGQAHQKENLN